MDLPRAGGRPLYSTGSCSTRFPLRRRTSSTSGNKSISTSISRPSLRSRPANQQGNLSIQPKNQPTHSRLKHMKNLITLTGIASIGVVLALISACETTGTGGGVASQQGQPGQQLIQGQSLYPTLETAGPNNIEVQQFGGFGPMGTAALGDW